EQEKTETIEYLPLSDSAIDILKERQRESADEEKSPYVFPRIKEKEDGRKTVYNWMHRKLKVWAKAAGIDPKKLHFHTGRHSFATNVLESADGDLYTKCKWLDHLYDWVYIRGNDEKFSVLTTSYSDKAQQVKWVSIHYRCLLTCVLTISDMKTVEWADLAELTNAFTFLITTPYFQELPDNYPFTKEIVQLKDKLRTFCLETQNEACVQLKLKFDTKKELLLHRYELSMFPKITFHQLQMDFKAEHEKQVKKQKEEQEREKQLKEERPWQKRWREMNIK
ncbi:MAG: tyrosine-type recombinase/integrase, partial [Flavobacteriales bacterium]